MLRSSGARRALTAILSAALIAVGAGAVSLAAGGGAETAAKKKVKVKCPTEVSKGKKVKCKLKGKLPRGKRGKAGADGAPGTPGSNGATGAPGLSGYQIVTDTFDGVFVINSGGQRGLSDAQTVDCPAGKSAIGGGTDLGTNDTQNGQQRQVTVSASEATADGGGWSVQLFNNSTSIDTSIDLEVHVICAKVG